MSLGEGIFYSALLLSVVGLYAATKDRWKWKRIAKWGIGLPFALAIVLGLITYLYEKYEERPQIQNEFGGISLTSTQADIRFLKGAPLEEHSKPDRWVYPAHSGSGKAGDAFYIVQFRDTKVRYITYWSNEDQIINPYVLGLSVGSSYDEVVKKLGQPSSVSTSSDGLKRLLSFEKYQAFFEFSQGKVLGYGIYAPATGPIKFRNEVDTASPAASSLDSTK